MNKSKSKDNRFDEMLLEVGRARMEAILKDEESLKQYLAQHPLTQEEEREIDEMLAAQRIRLRGRVQV